MDFGWLINLFGPIVVGSALYWFSGKCRGRNARTAFRFAAWGVWLLLLFTLGILAPFPAIPILGLLNVIVQLAPSVICFLLAINALVREARSQQRGEFTDAA